MFAVLEVMWLSCQSRYRAASGRYRHTLFVVVAVIVAVIFDWVRPRPDQRRPVTRSTPDHALERARKARAVHQTSSRPSTLLSTSGARTIDGGWCLPSVIGRQRARTSAPTRAFTSDPARNTASIVSLGSTMARRKSVIFGRSCSFVGSVCRRGWRSCYSRAAVAFTHWFIYSVYVYKYHETLGDFDLRPCDKNVASQQPLM